MNALQPTIILGVILAGGRLFFCRRPLGKVETMTESLTFATRRTNKPPRKPSA